jgi:hypothetical protein
MVAKSPERGEVRYEVAGMEGSCVGSGDEDDLLVRLRDLRCIFADTIRRRFKVKIHHLFALSAHSLQRNRVPLNEFFKMKFQIQELYRNLSTSPIVTKLAS